MLKKSFDVSGGFISLTFFCGRHLDRNEAIAGGRGLIKSLISQMLVQYSFDTTILDGRMIQDALNGDLGALCALFRSLAHQLPSGITLVCLIDGIKYYERADFENEMGEALVHILNLLQAPNMASTVKVLVTSPLETKIVRVAFSGCILSMSSATISLSVQSHNLNRELRF